MCEGVKKPIEHTLYCAITTEILNEVYRGDPSWPSLSTLLGLAFVITKRRFVHVRTNISENNISSNVSY